VSDIKRSSVSSVISDNGIAITKGKIPIITEGECNVSALQKEANEDESCGQTLLLIDDTPALLRCNYHLITSAH